jgi:uncharacterized protein YkwD
MKSSSLATVLLLLTPRLALAQSSPAERTLFQSVNRDRKAHNQSPLRWDESLATAARKHAHEMAKRGAVEHTFPGEPSLPARANKAGARFISISENVVRAANAKSAHSEFMNSPNHKANILDADTNSIGIGAAELGGEMFVVEDFSRAKK